MGTELYIGEIVSLTLYYLKISLQLPIGYGNVVAGLPVLGYTLND